MDVAHQAQTAGQARTASAHAAGADRRLDGHGGAGRLLGASPVTSYKESAAGAGAGGRPAARRSRRAGRRVHTGWPPARRLRFLPHRDQLGCAGRRVAGTGRASLRLSPPPPGARAHGPARALARGSPGPGRAVRFHGAAARARHRLPVDGSLAAVARFRRVRQVRTCLTIESWPSGPVFPSDGDPGSPGGGESPADSEGRPGGSPEDFDPGRSAWPIWPGSALGRAAAEFPG